MAYSTRTFLAPIPSCLPDYFFFWNLEMHLGCVLDECIPFWDLGSGIWSEKEHPSFKWINTMAVNQEGNVVCSLHPLIGVKTSMGCGGCPEILESLLFPSKWQNAVYNRLTNRDCLKPRIAMTLPQPKPKIRVGFKQVIRYKTDKNSICLHTKNIYNTKMATSHMKPYSKENTKAVHIYLGNGCW